MFRLLIPLVLIAGCDLPNPPLPLVCEKGRTVEHYSPATVEWVNNKQVWDEDWDPLDVYLRHVPERRWTTFECDYHELEARNYSSKE